jgi:hypothetical protein
MPDRLEELESRIEALTRALQRVEGRLERLESPEARGAVAAPAAPVAPAPREEALPAADAKPALVLPPLPEVPQGMLALVGRTIIALGGGFLIRALTDADIVPAGGGVALGIAYALACLLMADRSAAAGARASASFHGLASGLIAYPLLVEATARFGLLSPPVALAVLVAVFGAGLAVAYRRDLPTLAWSGTCLALVATAALLVSTRHLLGSVLALLVVCAFVEWLAVRDRWTGLRWPAALFLDLAVLILIVLVTRPEGLPEGYPVLSTRSALAVALALPSVTLAAVLARTLARGRAVTGFELVQTPVAILLGFGGASSLLATEGSSPLGLGLTSLLIGALAYAAAFAFVERRPGQDRNFYFYSAAGGLLTLAGTGQILAAGPRSIAWCLLGIAGAVLGRHFGRMTLRFHGALYAAAAAVGSGLAGASWRDFAAPSAGEWTLPTPAGLLVAASVAVVYGVLAVDRAEARPSWERAPNGIAAATLIWVVGGMLVAALVAAAEPFAPGAAGVATVRTAVLSFLVVALAWTSQRRALPELGWFVYPLLAIGGLKLLSEDLTEGRAATLFLSLVLYGSALIGATRLLRRKA